MSISVGLCTLCDLSFLVKNCLKCCAKSCPTITIKPQRTANTISDRSVVSGYTGYEIPWPILICHTRKDNLKDNWSTDPLICTPIFPQTMSHHRFEQIWTFWHFNGNTKMDSCWGKLFHTVLNYFLHKFRTIYKPKQQLSLDERMIPGRGCLKFHTYTPAKITKSCLLVRVVCERDTGYVCNVEIHTAEERNCRKQLFQSLDPTLAYGTILPG